MNPVLEKLFLGYVAVKLILYISFSTPFTPGHDSQKGVECILLGFCDVSEEYLRVEHNTFKILTSVLWFTGQGVLADGTGIRAKQILLNATPAVTFLVYSSCSWRHK
jgi:hypothetical protein